MQRIVSFKFKEKAHWFILFLQIKFDDFDWPIFRVFRLTRNQVILIRFSDAAYTHACGILKLCSLCVEFVTHQTNKQRCEIAASDGTNTHLEGRNPVMPNTIQKYKLSYGICMCLWKEVRKGCSVVTGLLWKDGCALGVQGVHWACQNWSVFFWLVINCLFIRLIWSIAFYWHHIFCIFCCCCYCYFLRFLVILLTICYWSVVFEFYISLVLAGLTAEVAYVSMCLYQRACRHVCVCVCWCV